MHTIHRAIGWALIATCGALAGVAHAAGVFDSVTGTVTVTGPGGGKVTATQGAKFQSGSTVTTADGAQAVVKFDDGSAMIVDMNSSVRLVDYRFNADEPAAGRSVFDFLKGAARFVTGLIARTEAANFALRTPVATMGVRGTDFDVASGSLYIAVNDGVLTATNAAGTVAFGGGQDGYVANAGTLPSVVPPTLLPDSVGGAFARLNSTSLPSGTLAYRAGGGGSSGGAGQATGAASSHPTTTDAAIALGVLAATIAGQFHASATSTHH